MRRTTSEGTRINGNSGGIVARETTNGDGRPGDVTTEDEWSRASSEDRSDYDTEKQSTDDLDKKVSFVGV